MPVTCGTRLERLEALARQVQVEIELERRAQREGRVSGVEPQPLGRAIVPVAPRPSLGNAEIAAIMTELDVTAADVRTWARERGMNVPERGTLRGEIVAAYRDAHQPAEAPDGATLAGSEWTEADESTWACEQIARAAERFRELNPKGATA